MPLDKMYYERYIDIFEKKIKSILTDDVIGISIERNFSNRGFFKLTYEYLPCNYKIVIENEFRTFNIIIYDSEGASNVLNRIEHHNGSLNEENITKSVLLLKKVLEKNDLNFYFSVDNKIYKKNRKGVQRIKDIREILNG